MKCDGKINVDFDTIGSKDPTSHKHWYKVFCVDTGRIIHRDGPFRDNTEAENAAINYIKSHKYDFEYEC